MGNVTGKSYHGNCPLWKNGPKWLNLESFNLLECRLLRGRKGSSLLVHVLSHFSFSHFTSYSLIYLFFYPLSFSLLSISIFYLCFLLFFLVLPPLLFTVLPQLLLACCGCPSLAIHWFAGCPTTITSLCWNGSNRTKVDRMD